MKQLPIKNMLPILGVVVLSLTGRMGFAGETPGTPIDVMDTMSFKPPPEKARVELVEGKHGRALRFVFDDDAKSVFVRGRNGGNAEWDKAAGFSFWVKGDGSDHLGGLEFIWNNDYNMRYGCAFRIDSTEWRKIMVPWRDLIPELSTPLPPIDPQNGNAPSKLGGIHFGKWWYWGDYAAHSYTVDEIRLEPTIPPEAEEYRPAGAPLERVQKKLKARQPITIVTMGDSLTDFQHWSNRETNWPTMLQAKLKQKYGSKVNIVNPALSDTELRHNLVLLPRWTKQAPAPDLVMVFFGSNDYDAGMRGEAFRETIKDTVKRLRHATAGQADVLILTTSPALDKWEELAELAAASRQAATERNAGLADVYAAFLATDPADREKLFAWDKAHLALPGHDIVAETVLAAIENGGR